jgi:hypothetical protein
MAYDLLITNGAVVDGNRRRAVRCRRGGAGRHCCRDRKKSTVPRRRSIDAAGKIVCPGFVDPHTHYDAQITWDRLLSSSAEHGVTTVVMGNCGVGIAPCRPDERDWLADDLVTVEGIDKEVLTEGIKWEWENVPAIYRRGGAPRFGAQSRVSRTDHAAAHLRAGRGSQRARGHAGGDEDYRRDAGRCDAGRGVGLHHHRQSPAHRPWRQTAGRAPRKPRRACRVRRRSQTAPARRRRARVDQALRHARGGRRRTAHVSAGRDRRPVTWLSLTNLVEKPGAPMEILDAIDPLIRRGGIPQILTRPLLFDMNLRRPFMLSEVAASKPLFDATHEKQMAIYADEGFRSAFKEELKLGRKWPTSRATSSSSRSKIRRSSKHEGKTVGEIAQERTRTRTTCSSISLSRTIFRSSSSCRAPTPIRRRWPKCWAIRAR